MSNKQCQCRNTNHWVDDSIGD